jgi:hypothetical protein
MMPFKPKGYVFLDEIIRTIGDQKYGQDWIGGEAAELRTRAGIRQFLDVTHAMRRELAGTPTKHEDAVPAYVKSDAGSFFRIPPELWLNDATAKQMLETGRTQFHPAPYPRRFNGIWAPDAAPLSGEILLSEASLASLIERIMGCRANDELATVASPDDLQAPAQPETIEKLPDHLSPEEASGSQAKQSARAARTAIKEKMYAKWMELVPKYHAGPDGKKRLHEQIAKSVAKDAEAKDPSTGKPPAHTSVVRRLNEHYPGWADKAVIEAEKT